MYVLCTAYRALHIVYCIVYCIMETNAGLITFFYYISVSILLVHHSSMHGSF